MPPSLEEAAPSITTTTVLAPKALCHVVLKTTPANFQPIITFYLTLLGAHLTHSSPTLAFLTYDHEHHRLAILYSPSTVPRAPNSAGLAHIAFGYSSLSELARSYQQRKALGILQIWCVNHGMSTSMYYVDPGGNELEMQVDNFETAEEAVDFMGSEAFRVNPVGVDFRAEELVGRLEAGEGEESIKRRVDIGERTRR
jgi:catechol-2,3-dioxygenase